MISVIIPTYNCEQYIVESLNSVKNQTFDDFEIIVIDDGSTDGTKDVVTSNFPEVSYTRISNGGAARARNIGIKKARGEYIAFLDADDLWLPQKLEKQVQLFQKDPDLMMVFTETLSFDEQGFMKNPFSKRERIMQGDIVKNIFLYSYVGTPTVMVRKTVFNEVGCFEECLSVGEDDNLWLRIAMKFKIDLLDEVLVHCRTRYKSLTQTKGNFFKGVIQHIDLIDTKYPEIRDRLGAVAIRKKMAECYFIEGYSHFCHNELRHARKRLVRSFFIYPKLKSLLYYSFSHFSETSIERIRHLKRKFNIRGF